MLVPTSDMPIPYTWQSAIIEIQSKTPNAEEYLPEPTAFRGFHYEAGNALTTGIRRNSIASLGWSVAETLETYLRLRTFAEDWDYPGMEAYDDL